MKSFNIQEKCDTPTQKKPQTQNLCTINLFLKVQEFLSRNLLSNTATWVRYIPTSLSLTIHEQAKNIYQYLKRLPSSKL